MADDASVVRPARVWQFPSAEPGIPPSPLNRRVQILEEEVEGLEQLPAHIDSIELQILQLRDEVRIEFSEMREEMREGLGGVRDELRGEMRELHSQAIARIALTERALLHEMGQFDERAASRDADTRRMMRVLYEDLIDRITTTITTATNSTVVRVVLVVVEVLSFSAMKIAGENGAPLRAVATLPSAPNAVEGR